MILLHWTRLCCNIVGKIAFNPFNDKGEFLFHDLLQNVFNASNTPNDFIFNDDVSLQKQRLKEFCMKDKNIEVSNKDIEDATKLISSIFCLNFHKIANKLHNQKRKPYVLLVAGGSKKKAKPLKILLSEWKDKHIISGLVTSEDIAKEMENKY